MIDKPEIGSEVWTAERLIQAGGIRKVKVMGHVFGGHKCSDVDDGQGRYYVRWADLYRTEAEARGAAVAHLDAKIAKLRRQLSRVKGVRTALREEHAR